MEIPKTTTAKPYIEFRFDKKGNIKLSTTSSWWGGINGGFCGSGEVRGNTCLPKDLNRYILAFKKGEIKDVEKQIEALKKRLQNLKSSFCEGETKQL